MSFKSSFWHNHSKKSLFVKFCLFLFSPLTGMYLANFAFDLYQFVTRQDIKSYRGDSPIAITLEWISNIVMWSFGLIFLRTLWYSLASESRLANRILMFVGLTILVLITFYPLLLFLVFGLMYATGGCANGC